MEEPPLFERHVLGDSRGPFRIHRDVLGHRPLEARAYRADRVARLEPVHLRGHLCHNAGHVGPDDGARAEMAGRTRRTFYRLFDGTDAVLAFAMDSLGRSFGNAVRVRAARSVQDYALEIFRYWESDTALLQALCASGKGAWAMTAWMEGASSRLHGLEAAEVRGNPAAAYLEEFMFGGMGAVLAAWARDEARPAPEVMARIVSLPLKTAPLSRAHHDGHRGKGGERRAIAETGR